VRAPKLKGANRVYISTAEIAGLLGWRIERVRRWLEREGALRKIGRHYYTTKSRLRAAFPEIQQDIR
jgi:hypothetical protein